MASPVRSLGDPPEFLQALFAIAVAAAQAETCLPTHLPPRPKGRTFVLGAGKAAAAMARVLEDHWQAVLSGTVVTCDGYAVPCRFIEVLEAAHPVPDARSVAAANRLLEIARVAQAGDLVICLLSGGASSVLAKPAEGVTLEDKQSLTRTLLASGAAIDEINVLRKHLSAIKGGRLAAAAAPAMVVNLIISDVVGDDPSVIGSGPSVADLSTCADALAIANRYGLVLPPAARAGLELGTFESPKGLTNARETSIIATPRVALSAAARYAESQGVAVLNLGDRCKGEAQTFADEQAALVGDILAGRGSVRPPCVVISGGELTVRLRANPGRGGPNTTFALCLARLLEGRDGVWILAGDSDGLDGRAAAAGGLIGPDTLTRARAMGLDPVAALQRDDSAGFLAAAGGLFVTGPTFTNVNDVRAVFLAARDG